MAEGFDPLGIRASLKKGGSHVLELNNAAQRHMADIQDRMAQQKRSFEGFRDACHNGVTLYCDSVDGKRTARKELYGSVARLQEAAKRAQSTSADTLEHSGGEFSL